MKGPFSRRASEILRQACDAEDVLLTTSCTDALEMVALLLKIRSGDVVVVPSFTFVSTALAFVRAGATLRFCDIESTTLGIDPAHLATLLDERVKAVVTVHYAGVGCDIAGIEEALTDWPDIALIEDNAHGLFSTYRGRPLGSFGRFSTLSFHETKNFICGEGGALVVNNVVDIERSHVLLDKGTNRREFMLGQVDKYTWQDVGSSFGLSDILAAFLCGQLEARDEILSRRRNVWERYFRLLDAYSEELELSLPRVPSDREQSYHMFYVLLTDRQRRDSTLAAMVDQGVHSTFHYVPLHSSTAGVRYSDSVADCPVTDSISGRLLRLPFFNNLSEAEAHRVVDTLRRSLGTASG
jgi:dTDP-4-amino-4,6-dideoxygalactose transaminase